ncbi:receptor-type adenylate cyclase, putative [Leishmania tarentolae]|uniref:Receptor-type adenylate cyclase, putative n=1 Tax=Leishmania tarentolae TaxID=5689 RepID=A0A640KE41_LEITA|nr:receptor-type adenylate cyclase, putative [Leishmania tarentolae]
MAGPTCRGTRCVDMGSRSHQCALEALRVFACGRGLRLVALAVLAVVAAVLCAARAAFADDETIYLLNATYSLDPSTERDAKAVWLGIDSALHASGYRTATGRPIEIVNPDPSVDQSDIIAVVQKALVSYPTLLGVIGPYMDTLLSTVMKSDAFEGNDLMFLAPFTGSNDVRVWNDNVYFTRGDARTEMTVILTYTLKKLRVRRTAFMYLTGALFGDREYGMLVSVLSSLSLDPPFVYAAPYSKRNTDVNTTAFDAMADTHPQVVIVWGMPGEQVVKFLQAVLTDPRTSSAYIISCFALQRTVFQVYYDLAMDGKLTPVDGQILSSATSFPLTGPASAHLKLFKAQMADYMLETGRVDPSLWADEAEAVRQYGSKGRDAAPLDSVAAAGTFFEEHPSTVQRMLAGWLAGSLIVQTLKQHTVQMNRTAYKASLFDQARYVVGRDVVLGDYGGPCTRISEFLGAVCNCNQGGRAALLQYLQKAAWTYVRDVVVKYEPSSCYLNESALPKPLNIVLLNFSDYPNLMKAAEQMNKVIPLAIRKDRMDFPEFNTAMLSVTRTTAQSVLDSEFLNYSVGAVTGPVLRSMDLSRLLVISPVFNRPNTLVEKQNYLFLMPTLEQEMYILYSQMSSLRNGMPIGETVNLIFHGYKSADVKIISAVARKTAATFNLPDPSAKTVSSETSVATSLASDMINLVLGLTADDVNGIIEFLSKNPSAIVIISFVDLAHEYDSLIAAFSQVPTSVQARLITFSSLPLWSDTSLSAQEAHPLLKLFNAIFSEPKDHTPALLRDLLSIVFIQAVAHGDGAFARPNSLQESAYKKGVVSAYSMTLGRFTWNCTTTTSGEECEYKNYGAQDIAMLSVQRMLDPTVPRVSPPSTPTMEYLPREKSSLLTPAQRNGLIAAP